MLLNNSKTYLSIIIPAYNEEKKIKNDIIQAFNFLRKEKINGELIISTDGITDNTNKIVKNLQNKYKNLILLTEINKVGKGFAIKKGVSIATGKYIMFADAGYCVPFKFINDGLKLIRKGYDCVLASRIEQTSHIEQAQPLYRQIGSKIFGFTVRILMGIPKVVRDTQCGFKIYKKNVAKKLFNQLKTKGFMFDIELILRAKKLNYKINTFPVSWSNDFDTKFNPISGSMKNFKELFSIKFIYRL